jgi:hypothetical protein
MSSPDDPAEAAQPGAGRVMGPRLGISLLVTGAILLFAVTVSSPHWLNWRIVGVILILTGALGMALPRRSTRSSDYPDWMSRWVLPGQFPSPGDPVFGENGEDLRGSLLVREISEEDPPTLADDVLSAEHDPPL